MIYAEENEDLLPDRLERLYPEYVDNTAAFSCPLDPAEHRDFLSGEAGAKSSSYVLVSGLRSGFGDDTILLYHRSTELHAGARVLVRLDGRVESLPEAEFHRELAAQRSRSPAGNARP
jgi:hypothetical protein